MAELRFATTGPTVSLLVLSHANGRQGADDAAMCSGIMKLLPANGDLVYPKLIHR